MRSFAPAARLYSAVKYDSLLLFVVPTVWAVVLAIDAQLWVLLPLLLSAGFVPMVHDPRIGLPRRGGLREQPSVVEWAKIMWR